ncbi:nuclear pore complex protein Nup88 [Lucilia sericata]|uniref:nuclear pore complex protein Nup88 n=1 Tax=Lucilia sericata TaxID=13632 RepID=UPI0018A85142|nr:nuclear pore complex protein Nup88 [Lucilia sericata]
MASTDCLQLNKTSMFAKIRAGLPMERLQTQNLLECKDDLLYCWDSQENSLLVLNWRAAVAKGFEEVKYQTLIPYIPLSFEVERVLTSNEGSLIALAGPRGVCVLELPRRWGANGQFMEGKAKITCRASNLDGHFFTNNPHLELRQLRWHPASPTDSHLLVLLSDNTIRVYDNASLRHVWQVGPIPLKTDGNPNSSTVYALGEAAVDFDIAPAVNVAEMQTTNMNNTLSSNATLREQKSLMNSTRLSQVSNRTVTATATSNETIKNPSAKAEKIEWPIVILRENGNIYVLMSGLDTDRPRLQGPLTITPSTVDNYGVDSCSILVIPSLPPTLVIAETNGKLHHALFMEAENAEDSFNEVDENLIIHPSEWTVHVLETVELELGLPKEELHQPYYCPIHLKRDFINELRYFAYHNTGLHVITVNFIAELQRYLENEVNSDINTLSTPSHAEYIVCTKIDTSENVNAVLGFVLMQMPSCAVLLLSSGQVISLKLVIDPKLLTDPLTNVKDELTLNKNDDLQQTQLNQILGPSFVDHVKNILKRTVTQPILSLDKSANPTPQECYELMTQAVEVLRTQYLKRHELVRAEFARRIHTIKLCKEQQKQDIEDLEREREIIRDKAHKLAERFEEISDQQEVLTKRCQDLMRQANTCLPSNTLAEKEFAQEVERINKLTKNMVNALQKSKEAINKQLYHISKYQENSKKKTFELPETQERTIKEIILQMTAEIDGQIKEVKRINKIVGI